MTTALRETGDTTPTENELRQQAGLGNRRVWIKLRGIVVEEPLAAQQHRAFANWTQSSLVYEVHHHEPAESQATVARIALSGTVSHTQSD